MTILFIVSALTPMVIGYTDRTTDEEMVTSKYFGTILYTIDPGGG